MMNDACTINVSWPWLVSSITIVNLTPQFGAYLTDNSGVVLYDRNMFMIQATGFILLV